MYYKSEESVDVKGLGLAKFDFWVRLSAIMEEQSTDEPNTKLFGILYISRQLGFSSRLMHKYPNRDFAQ